MTASLIIAASEVDSNLYYACRFMAPDPFVFLQVGGRKVLLMSDLEVDRARKPRPSSAGRSRGSPTPSACSSKTTASPPSRCPPTSLSRRPTGCASAG